MALHRKVEDVGCQSGRRWEPCITLTVFLLGSLLFAISARAGERAGPVRIGVLTDSWGPTPGAVGLRDGLQELGYQENRDFVIGVRFTQGDTAALPAAARELVGLGTEILFTEGRNSAKAAQMATNRIPIVFAGGGDPVGLGLIHSFARPGGHITGVTDLDQELGPKRLQLFREIIPGVKRVVFLYDAADAYAASEAKGYREASRLLGLILVEKLVRTQQEAQRVLANVRRKEGEGILSPRSVSSNIPGLVAEATSKRGIPTMFPTTFFPELGGLASYGATTYESGRQAARLVDKILKGADPARIPVEVNTNIEFVINVKVARTLGLTIAPELLYQADRLIR